MVHGDEDDDGAPAAAGGGGGAGAAGDGGDVISAPVAASGGGGAGAAGGARASSYGAAGRLLARHAEDVARQRAQRAQLAKRRERRRRAINERLSPGAPTGIDAGTRAALKAERELLMAAQQYAEQTQGAFEDGLDATYTVRGKTLRIETQNLYQHAVAGAGVRVWDLGAASGHCASVMAVGAGDALTVVGVEVQ